MYAKYVYNAGATAANILSDVIAIMTGTTDIATLSASCNKPSTTIIATIPAGWTMHDAAASDDSKVIKAPLADDPTKFKYARLDTWSAGYLIAQIYETWNATDQTYTFSCYNSNTTNYCQRWSATLPGEINIFASERYFIMASLYNGLWGSSSSSGPSGCIERTRMNPWDTVIAGWPPFAFTNFGTMTSSGGGSYAPRILRRTGAELSGNTAQLYCYAGSYGTVGSLFGAFNGVDQQVPDGEGGSLLPFYPLTMWAYQYMPTPYGEMTELCDIWIIPQGSAANKDIIQKGGLDYMCLQANGTTKMFALRKG